MSSRSQPFPSLSPDCAAMEQARRTCVQPGRFLPLPLVCLPGKTIKCHLKCANRKGKGGVAREEGRSASGKRNLLCECRGASER